MRTHTCMHALTRAHTHTHTHTHACMHTYMHARMVALLTYAPPPLHIPLYAECLAMPHLIYIAVSIVASLTFLFGAFLMVSSCLVQGIPLAEHLPRAVMHRIPLAEQQLSLSFPMVVRVALPAICMFAVSFICMFAASFIFLFAVFFPSFYLMRTASSAGARYLRKITQAKTNNVVEVAAEPIQYKQYEWIMKTCRNTNHTDANRPNTVNKSEYRKSFSCLPSR